MTCLSNFLGNAICKISFLLGFMVVVLGAWSGTSACKIEGLVFVYVLDFFWVGGGGGRYLCELAYY